MKNPRAKSATVPIRIPSFGCVNALMFDKGGYADVQMNALEVKRLLQALQRYTLRRKKVPSTKVLAAIDVLHDFLETGEAIEFVAIAEVVMGFPGVKISPLDSVDPRTL